MYGLRLSVKNLPVEENAKRAESLLDLTHLTAFALLYPNQLSGGMKQRASVARALAFKPSVILMYEPFSALDTFTMRELVDGVMRIWQDLKTTFLMVTHNPEEAIYIADRIVILSGRPVVVFDVLHIDLPDPRDPADAEFIRIREQVTRMIRRKA